jgi:hypothetical protein
MEATATDHSPTLEVVERQFTAWRSRRIGRERIPAKLWQSAVELCATQPITRVCQRLRLSFTDLKLNFDSEIFKPQ